MKFVPTNSDGLKFVATKLKEAGAVKTQTGGVMATLLLSQYQVNGGAPSATAENETVAPKTLVTPAGVLTIVGALVSSAPVSERTFRIKALFPAVPLPVW